MKTKTKTYKINIQEENLDLLDIIYRLLSRDMKNFKINYKNLENNLQIPDEIALKINDILYRFKITY